MWRSLFLVSLQAYSRQLYYQVNSFTGIFWQHFKPPYAPPMYWLKPPPHRILKSPPSMFSAPVGNPASFSDIFRGYRKATPGCNGLNLLDHVKYFFAIVLFWQKLPLLSHQLAVLKHLELFRKLKNWNNTFNNAYWIR